MTGMLAGTRVLDLTTVGPGARCAALLADLGAEVIKVGPPPSANRIVPADWAYSAGRGTRRLGVNLKDEAARDAVLALAATCDVLLEGFRPGVAARLGLGYDALRKASEAIVYASLTGYGQDGPYAQRAGHDINYQAAAGVLSLQGRAANGAPTIPGATLADSAGGGMHAALSICAALVRRATTGQGCHLDVAAVDGMVWANSLMLDEYLATGVEHGPRTNILTGRYAAYDVYACADGKYVTVGAIELEFFSNLCRLLGVPELAELARDDGRQDEVRAQIAAAFATRPRDEWVQLLADEDTCVAPVLSPSEVVADPHLRARGLVTEVAVGGQRFGQIGRPIAGSDVPPEGEHGVPFSHSDARDLLVGAGVDDATIDDLIAREVLR